MEKAQILVSSSSQVPIIGTARYQIFHKDFKALITDLFKRGNQEQDTNFITVVVVDQAHNMAVDNQLDGLSYNDKYLLLRYYFSHLNLIVVEKDKLDKAAIDIISNCVTFHDNQVNNRISRVQTWTQAGKTVDLDNQTNETPVFNMIGTLNNTINKTSTTASRIKAIKDALVREIDFKSLLSNSSTQHLSKLCNLVGHWSFPAHELTNDDLVYCVYLMLKYSMDQAVARDSNWSSIKLSDNELLALIFMTRDTYKNGNPFHNFRHAVDVLQACFHFVIRLGYLPIFTQFQTNAKANEMTCLKLEKFGNAIELIALTTDRKSTLPCLNKVSTLALLVAALGHDVGHPGVTNQFMIKYACPTSLLFNERSVLESFHSSVFVNRLLSINWPNLLTVKVHVDSAITVKDVIISSILATDMGEHFEYIEKLARFKNHDSHQDQIKLISSLLIKCADISNVTRPLRVSSQWALVLSREFDEVSKLEEKLMDLDKEFQIKYEKIPMDIEQILHKNPMMHKGQLFFINTFAQNLFDSITELLPELKYTGDIIRENKTYWEARDK